MSKPSSVTIFNKLGSSEIGYGGHHGLMTTYVTVGLSFVVWSLVILKPDTDPRVFLSALLIVIVLQPFELYHHFTKNYPLRSSSSLYEAPFNKFSYVVNQNTEDRWQHGSVEKVFEAYFKQIELYYASGGYSFLFKLIHQSIVFAYTNQKIYLYDNTKFVDDAEVTPEELAYFLGFRKNTALVNDMGAVRSYGEKEKLARWAGPDDKDVVVTRFNANMIELKLNLDREKFLVLTDSYHPSWKASIDGRPEPIVRTNIAFKGLWVPAGEHTVMFRFKTLGDLLFNYILIAIYAGIFVYLLRLVFKDYRSARLK
jgi:hypothetical protein